MECLNCETNTLFSTTKVSIRSHVDIVKCSKCEKSFEYNWLKKEFVGEHKVKHRIEII